MNTLLKFLTYLCLLLLFLAPGWTAFFERKTRRNLVLGVVLMTLISTMMLALKK